MKIIHRKVFWLGIMVLLTLMFAALYIVIQQSLRYAADDPQSSMAQAVARRLEDGSIPQDLIKDRVDMATDADPFIIIYDQFGKVVAGNGYLDNHIPLVPIGVLVATKGHKINAITWQPQSKVRIASVSVEGGKYYVLGGRSLYNTETKIKSVGQWLAVTWLTYIVLIVAINLWLKRRSSSQVVI